MKYYSFNSGLFFHKINSCYYLFLFYNLFWFQLNTRERNDLFSKRSILGDEILCQILCSVLMWVGRLQFNLELENARFLDDTWVLPFTKRLELVPCRELGVTVLYVVYSIRSFILINF